MGSALRKNEFYVQNYSFLPKLTPHIPILAIFKQRLFSFLKFLDDEKREVATPLIDQFL